MRRELLEQVFQRRFVDAQENYKAKCPFHDESTPSFYVHKDNLVGHCFGCAKGGYIDTLAAEYLNVSRQKARKLLEITPQTILEKSKNYERVSNKKRAVRYPQSWLSAWRREVHKSVVQRGFSIETLKRSETVYDPVLQRQVFPHFSGDRQLLGAAGRSCNGVDPKWYFYWNYEKGQALYRMPCELEYSDSEVIVTEGIFDVLWLYEIGYPEAAAILGSHPTKNHIQELRQYKDVYICLDNDAAGRAGTEILHKELNKSCNLYFFDWSKYPEGLDVMDIEVGTDFFNHCINYVQRQIIQRANSSSRVPS